MRPLWRGSIGTVLGVALILILTIIVHSMLTESLQCYPFSTAIHGTDGTKKQYTIDSSCNFQKQ